MPLTARRSPSLPSLALAACLMLMTRAAQAQSQLDLELYAELLTEYTRASEDVTGTRVAYAKLKREPRWERLLEGLRESRPDGLTTRDERLAFWINAYNILAIETVRKNFPLDSIKDVGSFWTPVWDREAGRIAGEPVTLGQIEHQILRPMREPRIHAAIVCASTSCPSLRREPFRAESLDAQLRATVRGWLSSPHKGVRIDRTNRALRISRIFDWFEEDWDVGGGVASFIAAHLPEADAAWLRENLDHVSIDHFDYDWTLNADPAR